MCVNYTPTRREILERFEALLPDGDWPGETWQDYAAPIITGRPDGGRQALVATYGMIPQARYRAPSERRSTMNARAETVGERPAFAAAWRAAQLCLVPMSRFFEPNYESGRAVRWGIAMADGADFAVAGLWRAWGGPDGVRHSFTQLTINSDEHPLMRRFHKPGDEKRSLVIVPADAYDDWLACRNPERARSFLQLYPAELMAAAPAAPAQAVQQMALF